MLDKAYRYINDKNIFSLLGKSEDRAVIRTMLHIILSAPKGRELICKLGDRLTKLHRPVRIKVQDDDKYNGGGGCNEILFVTIGAPGHGRTERETARNFVWQALTLSHELGHALYFSQGEHKIDYKLPLVNRVYAEVWNEAVAYLWERDICAELAKICSNPCKDTITGVARAMKLLSKDAAGKKFENVVDLCFQEQFKSREDFIKAFFKKENFLLGVSVLAASIGVCRNGEKVSVPNENSDLFFKKLIDRRLAKENLALKYDDIPLEKCFFYTEPAKGIVRVTSTYHEALINKKDGTLLMMCDKRAKENQTDVSFLFLHPSLFADASVYKLIKQAIRSSAQVDCGLNPGTSKFRLKQQKGLPNVK